LAKVCPKNPIPTKTITPTVPQRPSKHSPQIGNHCRSKVITTIGQQKIQNRKPPPYHYCPRTTKDHCSFSRQPWNPNRKPHPVKVPSHPQETKLLTQATQEIPITHTQSAITTIQNPKENNTHPLPISTIQPPLTPNAQN
jgi:hypothetical protein